jgi:hypothetical protein
MAARSLQPQRWQEQMENKKWVYRRTFKFGPLAKKVGREMVPADYCRALRI